MRRQDQFDPILRDIMQSSVADANTSRERADQQWNTYMQEFRPVEQRMVQDASTIDSQENQAQAATASTADVNSALGAQRAATGRAQARMGINPNSGAALALSADQDVMGAAASAGAANQARQGLRDRGMAMRTSVANFGRGLGADTRAFSALGTQQGGAAQNAGGQFAQGPNTSGMYSGFNTAISGNNSAAGILNNQLSNQMSRYNSQMQLLGSAAGAAGQFYAMSSKKLKTEKEPVDSGKAMDAVRKTPVAGWKYRDGVADGNYHIGPYAEDVQKNMGDKAAPAGKMIDLISMNGISLAAIKNLDKRMARVEAAKGVRRAPGPEMAED